MYFLEVSAKTGYNIEAIFLNMVKLVKIANPFEIANVINKDV